MRIIQSKVLPENWLKLVEKFDIEKSSLSDNNKIIATYLMPIILEEKEKSLNNSLLKILIKFIIFDIDFLVHYDNLPEKLVKDAFDEIKNERGINLDRKLHSLFVEFITYQDLYKKGYQIVDSTREEGSCDLVMNKDDKAYNFEVKYKESPDVGKSRLYDYIDGYSLLKENEFLRDKTFEINLKVDNLNYSNLQSILEEIDIFISTKKDIYDGRNLQIFNSTKRNELNRGIYQAAQYSNNFDIQTIDDVDSLINKILIENNGHLTKLINKSKKYNLEDNFTGCLVWSIPFHMKIGNDKIKQAFQRINLDFDLFVYTGGIGRDEFNFFIPQKKGDIQMPTISMFYGIIIRMYCAPNEHNPPHIHVYYQDEKAVIDIQKVELTEGKLHKKKLRLVLAWVELRQEELLADWKLAQNGELPFKIDPLK